MPEASEGLHITPEDYVAQDEIFKVRPAARCLREGHHSATWCAGWLDSRRLRVLARLRVRMCVSHGCD